MERARSHRRLAGVGAFVLLSLAAEVVGRSLTVRLDLGRHVPTPRYAGADYYPFLLAGLKIGVALMLAALTWRFVRARIVLRRIGLAAPRVRIEAPVQTWALAFALTSGIYLLQTDSERLSNGQWPLFSPWLHTSALSVFAVLSLFVALLYRAVGQWLAECDQLVERAKTIVHRLRAAFVWHDVTELVPPRRLFGLSFESRPPPLAA
jgi:hypothetical protein